MVPVYKGFVKKSTGILGTCSLETKTDTRKLYAVFFFYTQVVKVVRCETLHNEHHV
jgi:hypothetical protein